MNGVTTLYLELDGIEWGSYDPAGTLKERTIRASGTGGAVVAVHASAGGLIRLLPNRQGSIIGWLRPDGKLGGAYTYDAYGNSPQAGAAGPSFRYAGMRYDVETGLYHTPNRAYDPADGRWIQLDPIGIKDGLNRYAYVKNSPLVYTEPSGLCPTCVVGAVVGAFIEAGFQLSTEEGFQSYMNFGTALAKGDLKGAWAAGGANISKLVVAASSGAVGAGLASKISKAATIASKTTNVSGAGKIAINSAANIGGNAVVGDSLGAAGQTTNKIIDGKPVSDGVGYAAVGGAVGGAVGAVLPGIFAGEQRNLAASTDNFIAGPAGIAVPPSVINSGGISGLEKAGAIAGGLADKATSGCIAPSVDSGKAGCK